MVNELCCSTYDQKYTRTYHYISRINRMASEEINSLEKNKSQESITVRKENTSAKTCFICNKRLEHIKYNLSLCKVTHSESQVTELLGRLVEDDWIVFVSEDDFLCHKCLVLLNQMDELELNLKNVMNELTQILKQSYNLASPDVPSAPSKDSGNDESIVGKHFDNKITADCTIVHNQKSNSLLTEQSNNFQSTKLENSAVNKIEMNECRIENNQEIDTTYQGSVCPERVKGFTQHQQHIKQRHGGNEVQIPKIESSDNIRGKSVCHNSNFNDQHNLKCDHNDINISVTENAIQNNKLKKSKHNLTLSKQTNIVNDKNDLIFCEECNTSVLKTDLEVHVSGHIYKYTCWACDLGFSDEQSLKIHQEICKLANILNLNFILRKDSSEDALKNNDIIKTENILTESSMAMNIDSCLEGHSLTTTIAQSNENDIIIADDTETRLFEQVNENHQDLIDNKTCFNNKSDVEETCVVNFKHLLKTENNENIEIDKNDKPLLLDIVEGEETVVSQIYICRICGFKDTSMSIVKKHFDNHNQVQRPFQCEYCNLSFTKKNILNLHVVRKHKNVNTRVCLFCKKMFLDKTHLNVHIEKCHTDIRTNPFCTYCGESHTTETDLKIHIVRHHFSDYNVQFPEEISLKDDLVNNHLLNNNGDQSLLAEPATNSVFDRVFSESLQSKYEGNVKQKDICSSLDIKCEIGSVEELCVCCSMCDFTCKEDSEMTNHIECHQTEENNYCKICCQFFCSQDCGKHLNHSLEFQSLQCQFCRDLCHDSVHLKCHIKKMHSEVNIHNCKYCNKVYSEKSALFNHVKTKHKSYKNNKTCDLCKMTFKNDQHYSNHMEYAHRKTLNCKMCGKELKDWKKLQYHEKAHIKHSKANYKCDICNKVLKTQTGLRFHKIRHTGNFPYFCEFCGQGFVSTHSLTEHIGHHIKETRYTCDVCGKGFYFYDTMYRHRILHDNPYPKTCDICNKKFRNSSRVAIHKRREHTGERPYKCTFCPQSFFTSNGYKHHLCLHTKVFPYNCKSCSKGFTTRHKYAIHLSRKHSDHTLLINRAPNNKEWNEQWLT